MKKYLSGPMRVAAKLHHAVFLLQKQADALLLQHHAISFMQAMILNIIKHHPDTTQHYIGQCTRFTPGAVSRQIEVLVEKGYVTRTTQTDNRRAQSIKLTQNGAELVDREFTSLNDQLLHSFSNMNEYEQQQLEHAVDRLIGTIDPEYHQFENEKNC